MGRVLIVDDAKFMRLTLSNIVTTAGYEVAGEAENGKQAFEVYKTTLPDLVIMDITMPSSDGIEGVKLIKAYDPDAKIIMCSAMGQEMMVIEAIKAGAKDFIVKPFTNERILAMIQKFIG